jgi:hypothetical protein
MVYIFTSRYLKNESALAAAALDLAINDALEPEFLITTKKNRKTGKVTKKKEFNYIRSRARAWLLSKSKTLEIFVNLCGYDLKQAKEKIKKVLNFYDARQKLIDLRGIYN